ncbi:MAG: SHOCT domain-containing protein [Anaerolineaceae bacterium]
MMGNFGYGFGGMGLVGMILGSIIVIGIVVGVILLIVWAVRKSNGTGNQTTSQTIANQSAKDIAQTRYAKGEITRDEYQRILADLGN